jgi:hypothetical protein
MGTPDNIATVRRFYAAGPSDDDAARPPLAADDIVWHVPGANRVSADYHGLDDVFRVMGERMAPLDRWELEPLQVMGNRDLVMAVVRLRASRYDRHLETTAGHVFRFDDDGLIVEAWGFVDDQAALDELLDPD